jgi:hypothetical protein
MTAIPPPDRGEGSPRPGVPVPAGLAADAITVTIVTVVIFQLEN